MKKKMLSLALALAMCLGLAVPAMAAEPDFVIENGLLTQYNGPDGDVVIPDGVIRISGSSFYHRTGVTSVTIPASVTSVIENPFRYCTGMTNIHVSPGNPNYTDVDGVLFSKDKTRLIAYPAGRQGAYVIPDGVVTIDIEAFYNCTGLTSVTIPNSVTSIKAQVFRNCENLTSVGTLGSITSIGTNTFLYCRSLTSVTIPDGVTSIGDGAFEHCESLTNLNIPGSVTSIGNNAFGWTPWQFSMGDLAVANGILFEYQGDGGDVVIPGSVTAIGNRAFYNDRAVTSVTIPDSVTRIGVHAFNSCGLTSVTIPASITTISEGAFYSCGNMTSVTIPSSVTSISNSAFHYCDSLKDVYYGGSEAQWKAVTVGTSNDPLKNAAVHYNSAGTQKPAEPSQPAAGPQVSGWAREQVSRAAENGLVPDGLGNNYQTNITRAQFAATAVKLYEAMSGQTAPAAGESPFTDTSDTAVIQAQALGIVSGVGNGKFAPNSLVTREQAAAMLSRVYTKLGGNIPEVAATAFADNDKVSSWARDAVAFMADKGIVSGVGNNQFAAQGNASIEQALVIALRMFDNLK